MATHASLALTLLLGIGLGATAIGLLRAQDKQPAYFIYRAAVRAWARR